MSSLVLTLLLLSGVLVLADQELEDWKRQVENEIRELKQMVKYQHSRRGRRSIAPEWTHCPNGFIRDNNSCYHVSHLLASWPDALVYCEAFGADLAFIETAAEQQFLVSYVNSVKASVTDPDKYFWVGGTDAVVEGQWIWAKTAIPVSGYTAWTPGNPNNEPSHASHSQDCMALYTDQHTWDDGYCETEHNFICEIELDADIGLIG